MPQLDKLTEKMAERGIQQAVLVGDQPMRLFSNGQAVNGPSVPMQQLQEMVQEIVPAQLLPQIAQEGEVQFPYQSPSGLLNIHVKRLDGHLQVALSPSAQTRATPSSQFASTAFSSPQGNQPTLQVQWQYVNDGETLGPVGQDAIPQLIASGKINTDTRVFRDGMRNWLPAHATELKELLSSIPVTPQVPLNVPSRYGTEDNGSGLGSNSSAPPPEIRGFNWGAFLHPLFWGYNHNSRIGVLCISMSLARIYSLYALRGSLLLLCILGSYVVSLGFAIWFGTQANRLAWRNRRWESINQFKHVQQKWILWGVCLTVVLTMLGLFTTNMMSLHHANEFNQAFVDGDTKKMRDMIKSEM